MKRYEALRLDADDHTPWAIIDTSREIHEVICRTGVSTHAEMVASALNAQGTVEDLGMAVDLLNHARCTDLGTDDKSWWRAQRDRLVEKWGR